MLFNFIVKGSGDKGLEHIKWITVEAASRSDAIQIYILNDRIENHHILKLISNACREEKGEIEFHMIEDLYYRLEGSTGFDLKDIKRNIDDHTYKKLLSDNLNEIEELIDEISNGRSYFAILELSDILTNTMTKSATKQ